MDTAAPTDPGNLSLAQEGTPLTGTAEAGALITVKDSGGTVIGTGVVGSDGSFSIALSPAQLDSRPPDRERYGRRRKCQR